MSTIDRAANRIMDVFDEEVSSSRMKLSEAIEVAHYVLDVIRARIDAMIDDQEKEHD